MSMRRLAQTTALAFLGIVFISSCLMVLDVADYFILLFQLSAALALCAAVWWHTEYRPTRNKHRDISAGQSSCAASKTQCSPAVEETPTEPIPSSKTQPHPAPGAFQPVDLAEAKHQLRLALGTQAGDAPTAAVMSQAKMLPGARAAMERFGLAEQQLRTVIANSTPRPADLGRYQFVVAGHSVIVSEDGTCILGVFPYSDAEVSLGGIATNPAKSVLRRPSPSDMPRKRGTPKADRRIAAPTTTKEMKELLERRGFEVELRGKHYNVTHPDFPGVRSTMAASPSDFRWNLNLISQIRGAFGVDLRVA